MKSRLLSAAAVAGGLMELVLVLAVLLLLSLLLRSIGCPANPGQSFPGSKETA